jgi:hypothetical protein
LSAASNCVFESTRVSKHVAEAVQLYYNNIRAFVMLSEAEKQYIIDCFENDYLTNSHGKKLVNKLMRATIKDGPDPICSSLLVNEGDLPTTLNKTTGVVRLFQQHQPTSCTRVYSVPDTLSFAGMGDLLVIKPKFQSNNVSHLKVTSLSALWTDNTAVSAEIKRFTKGGSHNSAWSNFLKSDQYKVFKGTEHVVVLKDPFLSLKARIEYATKHREAVFGDPTLQKVLSELNLLHYFLSGEKKPIDVTSLTAEKLHASVANVVGLRKDTHLRLFDSQPLSTDEAQDFINFCKKPELINQYMANRVVLTSSAKELSKIVARTSPSNLGHKAVLDIVVRGFKLSGK